LILILINCLDIWILEMKLGLKSAIFAADLGVLIQFLNISKIRILSYISILIIILNWVRITGFPYLSLLFEKSICIDTLWIIFNFPTQLRAPYDVIHIFFIILNIFLDSKILVLINSVKNADVSIVVALKLVFLLEIFPVKLKKLLRLLILILFWLLVSIEIVDRCQGLFGITLMHWIYFALIDLTLLVQIVFILAGYLRHLVAPTFIQVVQLLLV